MGCDRALKRAKKKMSVCLLGRKGPAVRRSFRRSRGRSVCCGVARRSAPAAEGGGAGRERGTGAMLQLAGLSSGRDPSALAARQAVLPARPGPGSARSRGAPAEPSPVLSPGAQQLPPCSALRSPRGCL